MLLKSVKTSKIPDQVWLIFEKDFYLPFFIDDWVKLNLTPPSDIPDDLFNEFLNSMYLYLLKSYALNQIALSPKSKADIIPKLKLKSRFISQKYKVTLPDIDSVIHSVLDYLESNQLLNESQYVDFIIQKYSHKSKNYIVRYLKTKQIDARNYPQLSAKNDLNLLQKLLQTKKYQSIKTADYKTKNKLIASLIRKGFTYEDIKDTI